MLGELIRDVDPARPVDVEGSYLQCFLGGGGEGTGPGVVVDTTFLHGSGVVWGDEMERVMGKV